ncbi:pyruvate formate-lyase-activating protein [Paractinoplanes toevensis]|uniref:pyruvate formate-lyase-activating protein n=1 Tax=Paractinoplanes toevensis TaxID=571911 RepID=UPI001FE5CB93|nr:pyruvate formate-lyase-activating protein [Actinoplanes toevensis]
MHSWDVVTAADGPGTRFVTFLAGCPLRCLYCHNPDTWQRRSGRPMTVEGLIAKMLTFRPFIRAAGGGVTVSGGEPLLQPSFVADYLRRCQEYGMHTALDTSGFLGARATDELLDDTDLVLLDVKSSIPSLYRKVTGMPLEPTIAFGNRLAARGNRIRLRFVLVPGLTDARENVEGIAKLAAGWGNIDRVDVLGYHRLGVAKYEKLGLRYPLDGVPPPTPEQLATAAAIFADHGLEVSVT